MGTREPEERVARTAGLRSLVGVDLVALVAAAAAVILPFVRAVRTWRAGWLPVGDEANVIIRSADVGTASTPLLGMPSGLINYVHTTATHPGPLIFWVYGPVVRAFGPRPLAIVLVGAAVVSASLASGFWLVWRQGRGRALLAGVVAYLVAMGLSQVDETLPLNPKLALVPAITALVAAWAVLEGDRAAWPVLVLTASFAAQAESAYTPTMVFVVLVVLGVRRRWARRVDRPGDLRSPGAAVWVLGALCWSGPILDVLRNRGGNVRETLIVAIQAEVQPQGAAASVRAGVALLDPFGWYRPSDSVASGSAAVVLAICVGIALLLLRRPILDRHRPIAVVALAAGGATVASQAYTPVGAGLNELYLLPIVPAGAVLWLGIGLIAGRWWSDVGPAAPFRLLVLPLLVYVPVNAARAEVRLPAVTVDPAVRPLAEQVRDRTPSGTYVLVPGGGPQSQTVLRGVGVQLIDSDLGTRYPADQIGFVGPRRIPDVPPEQMARLVITRADLATSAPLEWTRVASWAPNGRSPAELTEVRSQVAASLRASGFALSNTSGSFQIGQVLAACGRVDAEVLLDEQGLVSLGERYRADPSLLASEPDLVIATMVEEAVLQSDALPKELRQRFHGLTREDAYEIWWVPATAPPP